jgi:non-specific serine/threonine protein kinase/serine/threonine-protein kinase
MYDADLVNRFHSERQSLAIMEHPCIAKVFDAGTTAQGQPYFLMEFVPGQPITAYCDQKKLGIVDRLELFIQVCEGVQHAHQKAIIHRDLKPANILVVEVDGKPVPRIIDFGLAKSAAPRVSEQPLSLYTQFGQIIGSPGYMSPEQIDANIPDIDTRTDVFSLGVVLYVLLTGLEPFATRNGQRPRFDEWMRKLCDEDPPLLSAKVSADRESLEATASARSTDSKQLLKTLRGDLEWIVARALERNRERRYGTPLEFAADLRRYLNYEPIVAAPASTGYLLRRFIRRNRLAATFVGSVTVFGIVASAAGLIAVHQRNRAIAEATTADRTSRFMESLFKLADPGENRGNSVTVREVLDRGARDIGHGLEHEPRIRADLLTAMGKAYAGLGLYEPGKKLLAQARMDQEGVDVPPESRVRTMIALGSVLDDEDELDESKTLLQRALDIAQAQLPPDSLLISDARDQLADVLMRLKQNGDAERLTKAALAIDRKRGPDDYATLSQTLDTLAQVYYAEGRLSEAEAPLREALELRETHLGIRHALTAVSMNNLGALLYQSGRYAEAAGQWQEAVPVYGDVFGPEHPEVATLLNNLGRSALMAGRVDQAIPILEQAAQMIEKLEGPAHDDLVQPLNSLGMAFLYKGDSARARTDIDRALKIARLRNHSSLDQVVLNAADLELSTHRTDAASPLLSEARKLLETRYPPPVDPTARWRFAAWDAVNAEYLALANRPEDARATFARARDELTKRFGSNGFYVLRLDQRTAALEMPAAGRTSIH